VRAERGMPIPTRMPYSPRDFGQIAVAIRVLGSTISGMDINTVVFATVCGLAAKGGCQMMNVEQNVGVVRQKRNGVCHRCGWRGSVGKVGRRYRHQLMATDHFGRLCDDCVTTLLHGRTVVSHPHWGRRPETKPERRRQVA
jgi:hypothetical protein